MVKSLSNETNAAFSPDISGNLSQLIANGRLHPDAVSIAGIASLDTAILNERIRISENKEGLGTLIHELLRLDEYLRRMDEKIAEIELMIKALEAQHRETFELAQAAYERSFEAEDLTTAITDGISVEERERLIALLGPEAGNAPIGELVVLLEAQEVEDRASGDRLNEDAERIADQISDRKRQLNELEELRESYKNAPMEQREELEQRFDDFSSENATAQKENAVSANPDFNVTFG